MRRDQLEPGTDPGAGALLSLGVIQNPKPQVTRAENAPLVQAGLRAALPGVFFPGWTQSSTGWAGKGSVAPSASGIATQGTPGGSSSWKEAEEEEEEEEGAPSRVS